jgi:hypothetical protein
MMTRTALLIGIVCLLASCAATASPPLPEMPISPFAKGLPARISELIEPRCWVTAHRDLYVSTFSVNAPTRTGKQPPLRRVLHIKCRDGSRQILILTE